MQHVSLQRQGWKTSRRYLRLCLVCFCLFVAACDLLTPARQHEEPVNGELRLSFTVAKLFPAKTIVPDLDMAIAEYEIFGSGPNEAAFEESQVPGGSVFKIDLAPGRWEIQVGGKNNDGIRIGTGELVTDIQPGVVSTQTLLIHPLEGNGRLAIQVSWPDSLLSEPLVEGTIESSDGAQHSLEFPLAEDMLSAACSDTLAAGYYKISLQLTDAGVPVWGTMEAARIFAGYLSNESYTLVADVNRSAFLITLSDAMGKPIDITLTGVVDILSAGESMTVTAIPDEPVDGYQWYLQGAPVEGATEESITLGNDLSGGTYWLDILVTKGEMFSSEGTTFRVLNSLPGGSTGPLVINEIMINPDTVDDDLGEWVEVVNIGSTEVDLMNWIIKDEGSDEHTISQSLVIPAGGYAVLGANADMTRNDSVAVDYEYQDIGLTNKEDELLLVSPGGELVDAVRWGGSYDFPIKHGASIALVNPMLDNRRSVNWQASTTFYSQWNKGTPGTPN